MCGGSSTHRRSRPTTSSVARTLFSLDADADGGGGDEAVTLACSAPAGYVSTGGDCDDQDPTVTTGCDTGTGERGDSEDDGGEDTAGEEVADTGMSSARERETVDSGMEEWGSPQDPAALESMVLQASVFWGALRLGGVPR